MTLTCGGCFARLDSPELIVYNGRIAIKCKNCGFIIPIKMDSDGFIYVSQ